MRMFCLHVFMELRGVSKKRKIISGFLAFEELDSRVKESCFLFVIYCEILGYSIRWMRESNRGDGIREPLKKSKGKE